MGPDRTFGGPGKIDLWTKADSLTHLADLESERQTSLEEVMFGELAERRRGIVSFLRSLFDSRCNLPVVSVSRRSEPLPGESVEQRRARIQATVDAMFAQPHPEEFRFRFWG